MDECRDETQTDIGSHEEGVPPVSLLHPQHIPFFFFFFYFHPKLLRQSCDATHRRDVSQSRMTRRVYLHDPGCDFVVFFFRIVSLIVSCLLVSLQIDHAVRWLKIFGRRGQDCATDSTIFLLIFSTHN